MKKLTALMAAAAVVFGFASATMLAVVGPASASDEPPVFLVGYWDEFGRPKGAASTPFAGYQGFQLRIVNPTADDLEAVVAVFDANQTLFACTRVRLTGNDEAFLEGESEIWNAPGETTDTILRAVTGYPDTSREGAIKIVSLDPDGGVTPAALAARVEEGLVAWILNVGRVNVRADAHGGTGTIVLSFPSVIALQGFEEDFLVEEEDDVDTATDELVTIAGAAPGCGTVTRFTGSAVDP